MMIGVKGKQLCAGNPNADGQTDRRTDGQTDMVIPVYPPNFVVGGIKTEKVIKLYLQGWGIITRPVLTGQITLR